MIALYLTLDFPSTTWFLKVDLCWGQKDGSMSWSTCRKLHYNSRHCSVFCFVLPCFDQSLHLALLLGISPLGDQGTIQGAKYQTQINCVQDKHPTHFTVSLVSHYIVFERSQAQDQKYLLSTMGRSFQIC